MSQIDLNNAQCIHSANYIGHTDYHNICTGTVTVVQWGMVDWLSNLALGGVISALCLVVLGVIAFLVFILISEM